jgi:hypothetical protein
MLCKGRIAQDKRILQKSATQAFIKRGRGGGGEAEDRTWSSSKKNSHGRQIDVMF